MKEYAKKHAIEKHGDPTEYYATEASVAIAEKDFKHALKIIDEGLREYIDHPKLLSLKGFLFFKDGHYDNAIKLYRKILKIDPSNKNAIEMLSCNELLGHAWDLALEAHKCKDKQKAEKLFSEIAKLDILNQLKSKALLLKALATSRLGNVAQSKVDLKEAIRLDSSNHDAVDMLNALNQGT